MTVILSKDSIEYRQAPAHCTMCTGPLWPPFIFWLVQGQLCLCRSCIENSGKGLMADLVQARAIIDLQSLYPDHTLERQHLPTWIRNLKGGDGEQ